MGMPDWDRDREKPDTSSDHLAGFDGDKFAMPVTDRLPHRQAAPIVLGLAFLGWGLTIALALIVVALFVVLS